MFKRLQNILFKTILLLVFVSNADLLFSQDTIKKPLLAGLGAETYFTLSGHGGYYSGFLALTRGRGTFRAGPIIQKRSMQMNGAKAYFSYRIVSMNGEDVYKMNFSELRPGSLQVNIFAFLQYVQNSGLSYKRAVETQLLNIDSTTVNMDWNAVKLNTIEGGLGVELGLKLTKRVLWTNYLGLSVYSHTNYFPELYYDKTAVVLIAGTSLTIPTFRYKKHAHKK